jgi:hypothetical protein
VLQINLGAVFMADDNKDQQAQDFGVIIRAENGDIVRFDQTGIVMVLADEVIKDIAQRLPQVDAPLQLSKNWIDPSVLGDIDAWDVRRDGEWYVFNANLAGKQGPRQFRRLIDAEDTDSEPGVIADGAGPLWGLLALGGSRRTTRFDHPLSFPWHVLAPADEIGAVGYAGSETATIKTALLKLPELTRDAALGDLLVERQFSNHQALSLFMARAETDSSASVHALGSGLAYENLMTAIRSLKASAARMDRPAALMSIGLEYTLEDVQSDASTFRSGMLDLIAKLTADIAQLGLRCPPILSVFDCGTHDLNDHPILRAQWDLAWQGAEHGLYFTAPGYMFRQDRTGRPDLAALQQMTEMDACALDVLHNEGEWACPTFLLAETEPDPKKIRVRARALGGLVIDTSDPFGAGKSCGFTLKYASNAPVLQDVAVAEDDPQDIILTFDKAPKGKALELLYAFGIDVARDAVDYPSACGAIHDGWEFKSHTDVTLHRWALPAALPIW